MSSSFTNDNKRKSSRERSEALIQKKREIDKIRRQQQSTKKEAIEAPVFPQPRKITARQDSLARNITSVLGDSVVVSPLLFREPSNWLGLGTSRSGKGNIVKKGQENSSVSSTSICKSAVDEVYGNKLKSNVGGDSVETEGEGTPRIQTTGRGSARQQCDLLRRETLDQGHLSQPKSDYMRSKQHRLRSKPNTVQSHDSLWEKPASSFNKTLTMERDRASSIDSDVVGGVENILKEMVVDLSPSITGINTPSVNDSKFRFSPYSQTKKLEHHEATMQRASVNRSGLNDSDDSSDDETSDDDSDDGCGAMNSGWNLVDLMPSNVAAGERLRDSISEEPKEMIYESKSHSLDRTTTTSLCKTDDCDSKLCKHTQYPILSEVDQSMKNVEGNYGSLGRSSAPSVDGRLAAQCGNHSSLAGEDLDDDGACRVSSYRFGTVLDDGSSTAIERESRRITNDSPKTIFFPSLLVRLSTTIALDSKKVFPGNRVSEVGIACDSLAGAQFSQRRSRDIAAVSTGSETDQPVRRTNCVQVAIADGSSDWKEDIPTKRKSKFIHVSQNDFVKRLKREKYSKKRNQSSADDEWQHTVESKPSQSPSSPTTGQASGSDTGHRCSINNKKPSAVASVVLPDSSVPAEQERIHSPDWYMREGKRMKHEGDSMVDSRTGRTRSGETLNRALSYFEASLFFIMSGYVMESENDRPDIGSSHNSTSTSHCPTNMYQQTLPLLEFVLKMHPRVEQQDRTFERITLSCLRCQSFLYFRIFELKKEAALKYSEILTEQFKTIGRSSQTHSPWRSTNVAPNVLSPMSPAVPSPFTHRGPSPASSNGEQVSSSTQTGRMTPTSHSNYNFSQKMYDIYRQNHAIMRSLLQAHEKWDQGEQLFEEHADFFRNIDALCNRTITFHSCLRDVFIYYRMVLHQLRALMNGSPSS